MFVIELWGGCNGDDGIVNKCIILKMNIKLLSICIL